MLIFKRLLATVIIVWGVLALLVRSLTPLIDDLRPEIEQAISDRLGTAVTIGAVTARWYGLRPLIELRGIQVGPPGNELSIRRAALELAPIGWLGQLGGGDWGALLDGLKLTLEGLALTVAREPDGRFHVEGYGFLGGTEAPSLPRRLHLVDTRLRWIDRRRNAAPVDLTDISIRLARDDQDLDLRARLTTPAGTADAMARLDGYLGTVDWSGDSYLHLANLDVARLLAPYLPPRYGFRSLVLNLEGWTRWSAARPIHTQGQMSLRDLSLRPLFDGAGALDIAAASSEFSVARGTDNQLLIGLRRLRLAMPDRIWPENSLALQVAREEDSWALDLYAAYLDLADTSRIAGVRPVFKEARSVIEALRPRGQLEKLRLQLESSDGTLHWHVATGFRHLGFDAWRGVPAVEGLDGDLVGHSGDIRIDLQSSGTAVTFETLFRDPLRFDRLAGRLAIDVGETGWSLRSDELVADVPHLRTRTRLQLSQRDGEPLFIDLQSDFADGDAKGASLYYPVGNMRPQLVRWLDRSITDGRIVEGSALVHGMVDDFAFERTRSGTFEVLFDIADATLDYRPGWPPVDGLAARVHYHGNQLDIVGTDGRIFDSRIERVTARIASLKPISPVNIKGRLRGPLNDHLKVLREGVLRERFGSLAAGLQGNGETTLDLDFAVPLGKQGASRLNGRLAFSDNALALPAWNLGLDDISGDLAFTLDGLSAEGVQAEGLGRPVSIDVTTRKDGTTRVRTTARLDAQTIRQQLPSLPLGFVSGTADFVIDVDIPPHRGEGARQAMLRVSSPLEGIEIDLPPPLGKTAASTETLALTLPLQAGPAPGKLVYGDRLAARFDRAGERIAIRFDDVLPDLPSEPGLRLGGTLDELDIAAWHTATAKLPPTTRGPLPDIAGRIRVARLANLPFQIGPVDADLDNRAGAWTIGLDSPQLSGTLWIPADLESAPIEATLQRLVLEWPMPSTDMPTPPPDLGESIDPTGFPGLRLTVDDVQVNAAHLGPLAVNADPTGDGWHVNKLTLGDKTGSLVADARWARVDGAVRSEFTGTAESDSLGDLPVALGYDRQVEGASGMVEMSLAWAGDPMQFHPATVEGDMTLSLGKGRLVELDPGAKRIVGLLNLNALTRRLSLDFSDLFSAGFSFDSIDGSFQIRDGVASTDNLRVIGPAGSMEISGSTALSRRQLDHLVTVTPKLDATLPIAGTLAGGPVAGIAILVAQRLMAKEIDDVNRFEYRVQGAWDEPEITQLDTGGALSKLLKPPSVPGAVTSDSGSPEEARSATTPIWPDDAAAAPRPAVPAQEADAGTGNPLRRLINLLKQSKSEAGPSPLDQD
ncbi:MAG: YhdP family protein [Chromatiaceae bacterium]